MRLLGWQRSTQCTIRLINFTAVTSLVMLPHLLRICSQLQFSEDCDLYEHPFVEKLDHHHLNSKKPPKCHQTIRRYHYCLPNHQLFSIFSLLACRPLALLHCCYRPLFGEFWHQEILPIQDSGVKI